MRAHRFLLTTSAAVLALVAWQPASAQTIDSAQVTFLQAQTIQYLRFQDKRGINVFETSKSPGAAYSGFKLAWGAAFTQSFQALDHSNTADSVETSPANQVNRNRLMPIGAGSRLLVYGYITKSVS
jgi:hypothetical protein